MSIIIGTASGTSMRLDLESLLETRLLIQSNSGGGKSWALRKILEITAGKVQQLVLDPEGEFATLREKYDMVICAPHDADAIANPKTAALLARRLLETGVSAVLDIYDLKAYERQEFVRRFLDALVNAPRNLWRPVLVVLDEAHVYAPEKGKAESTSAVIDIATRGRKRGQCLVAATQRLSKLHKDVAAELLNKMIGRTGLDIDVKRAADEMGIPARTAITRLRQLLPGQFHVFGPAFGAGDGTAICITVGQVVTTHPKRGNRMMEAPPSPSAKIRKVLSNLDDLQKEAEQEARTIGELKSEVRVLRGRVSVLGKAFGVPEKEAQARERAAARQVMKSMPSKKDIQAKIDESFQLGVDSVDPVNPTHVNALQKIQEMAGISLSQEPSPKPKTRPAGPAPVMAPSPKLPANPDTTPYSGNSSLRAGAVRILQQVAARSPAGYSRSQVAVLTGFSPRGGTFNTYLGNLRKAGFIREDGSGKSAIVYVTELGITHLGDDIPDTPTSHDEAMAMWSKALRAGCYQMLQAIVTAGDDGIDREDLAAAVEMTVSGGTFNTYLGVLRRNGLIIETGKVSKANDILFPEDGS